LLETNLRNAFCGVEQSFRNFLIAERFVEIHTPKLIAASSEGGAAVFRLDYKGQLACLPFCVLMLLDNFQRAG
jgi:aspartyl/asparaginyl-tRNA synthetase